MIDTAAAELLESGGSITVGTVDAAGVPDAARAWLLRVAPGGARVRCLVGDHDRQLLLNVADGGRIALNWVHVLTLESMQVKGRVAAVEVPTDDDLAASAEYRAVFFARVHESDGSAFELLERLVPDGFVALEVDLEEQFDQTPGPNAGERR